VVREQELELAEERRLRADPDAGILAADLPQVEGRAVLDVEAILVDVELLLGAAERAVVAPGAIPLVFGDGFLHLALHLRGVADQDPAARRRDHKNALA